MSHHLPNINIPAPCIINTGIIVNKLDIRRLLSDLGRVRYVYSLDGKVYSEGEGDVMEVFSSHRRSTLVANQALYLNVSSFDYLALNQSPENETYFDLNPRRMVLAFGSPFYPSTGKTRSQYECKCHGSDDGSSSLRSLGCRNCTTIPQKCFKSLPKNK